MFEKFTVSSIKAIMFAQSEAQRLGHALAGTELLLVGLVLEQNGLAAQALKAAGLDRKKVREEVEKIVGRGSGTVPVEIPFTPGARLVIERARDKSKESGDNNIETEHLLLALLDHEGGLDVMVLESCNLDRQLLIQNILVLRGKHNSGSQSN